ncbi:hypothetical protein MES5069_190047 [Mesorhizobium escarrei]|uniref:Transposase DDE domain-containing protein n=1 Tax=Mesorhizobium escarrei TaxID=666018 RepID=A0ABM9DN68_9HYPH|nr:hypothetical protein MES5069_190047 [Mesorhizobium escarrei]
MNSRLGLASHQNTECIQTNPDQDGLSTHRLELKITESVLISDTTFIDPILRAPRDRHGYCP